MLSLDQLAQLVAIRNHIAFLVNTNRHVVNKDQVKTLGSLQNDIDVLFVNQMSGFDVNSLVPNSKAKGIKPKPSKPADSTAVASAVVVTPEGVKISSAQEPDLVSEPVLVTGEVSRTAIAKQVKASKKEMPPVDDEIKKRVNEAKKAMKKKPAKNG